MSKNQNENGPQSCLPSLGERCGNCHRCCPPEPDGQQFTINRITGEWITKTALTGAEACVIAASVMPGWTPELVDDLYSRWLEADGGPSADGTDL